MYPKNRVVVNNPNEFRAVFGKLLHTNISISTLGSQTNPRILRDVAYSQNSQSVFASLTLEDPESGSRTILSILFRELDDGVTIIPVDSPKPLPPKRNRSDPFRNLLASEYNHLSFYKTRSPLNAIQGFYHLHGLKTVNEYYVAEIQLPQLNTSITVSEKDIESGLYTLTLTKKEDD